MTPTKYEISEIKQVAPKADKRLDTHTISFLVANKPGVLVRVAQVFARRAFNIDSLVVSPSVDPNYSTMTITAKGSLDTLDQIIKQAGKLIDVVHVSEHKHEESIERELAIFKIKYKPSSKTTITRLLKKFNASPLESTQNIMVIEQTGTTDELDQFETELKKFDVVEMVRTGKVLIARGKEKT